MSRPVGKPSEVLSAIEKFNSIVERVEARCMAADGPVTPTLQEMREDELRDLWRAVQTIHAEVRKRYKAGQASGTRSPLNPVWYGVCGHWTADWSKLINRHGVPLCPLDGAPGFHAKAGWWQDVDNYEAADHPGYRKAVEALELP